MKRFFLVLLFVVLFYLVFVSRLAKPFFGHHEFNGVFYSQIAKNYLRYGLIQTKGAQVINSGESQPKDWSFHIHHPSTYPLFLAFVFSIFGVSEAAARSVSLVFSFLAIFYLWRFTKSFFAVFLIFLTPLFLYYAIMPVFEPLLLPVTSLGLIFYFKKQIKPLFFVLLLGILIDWPGIWLPFWIFVFEFFRKKKNWQMIKIVLLSLFVGIFLIAFHLFLIAPSFFQELFRIGILRFNFEGQPYTNLEWIKLLISRIKAFFGLPLILMSLGGIFFVLRGDNKKNREAVVLTFLIGFSHIFVFRNITWYHDYMLYHSLPFFALSTSIFLNRLTGKLRFVFIVLAVTLTFFTTQKFYQALISIEPNKMCLTKKEKDLNEEQKNQCGVFINFYKDRL